MRFGQYELLGRIAVGGMAEIYLAKGGRLMGLNLRVSLYSHLQRLSLAFYNQQRTGDLLTRVTSDVTALEDFVTVSLSDIVGSVLLIVFILVAMIFYDWHVALVALVSVPIMAAMMSVPPMTLRWHPRANAGRRCGRRWCRVGPSAILVHRATRAFP